MNKEEPCASAVARSNYTQLARSRTIHGEIVHRQHHQCSLSLSFSPKSIKSVLSVACT